MGRANAVLLLLLLLEDQRPQLSSRPLAALGRAGRQIIKPSLTGDSGHPEEGGLGSLGR